MTTTANTTTRLAYFKCADCLTPMAAHVELTSRAKFNVQGVLMGATATELARRDAAAWGAGRRCSCGGELQIMGLVARPGRLVTTRVECACNEVCTAATGPNCSCSCGGEHHGTGAVVAIVVDAGGTPRLQAPADAHERAAAYRNALEAARARIEQAHASALRARRAGAYLPEAEYWALREDQAALARAKGLRTHAGRLKALASVGSAGVRKPAGPSCPDCGQPGEHKGHQACQYPQD